MVGEGKDGVQSTEMTGLDSLPKTLNTNADGTPSNINRPRLDTPTLNAPPTAAVAGSKSSADEATGWRIRLWRKMTSSNRSPSQMLDDYRCREEPYVALPGDGDAISAVYAELNSVTGSIHRPGLDSMSAYPPYHLNTYSEIHEPRVLSLAPPPYAHSASSTVHHAHPHSHPHHHTLHLQRMLSDGTYENAGYAMERGLVLLEHHNNESGSGCASTPSSAYYSDLSNSDRSAGTHPPQLWGRPGGVRNVETPAARDRRKACHIVATVSCTSIIVNLFGLAISCRSRFKWFPTTSRFRMHQRWRHFRWATVTETTLAPPPAVRVTPPWILKLSRIFRAAAIRLRSTTLPNGRCHRFPAASCSARSVDTPTPSTTPTCRPWTICLSCPLYRWPRKPRPFCRPASIVRWLAFPRNTFENISSWLHASFSHLSIDPLWFFGTEKQNKRKHIFLRSFIMCCAKMIDSPVFILYRPTQVRMGQLQVRSTPTISSFLHSFDTSQRAKSHPTSEPTIEPSIPPSQPPRPWWRRTLLVITLFHPVRRAPLFAPSYQVLGKIFHASFFFAIPPFISHRTWSDWALRGLRGFHPLRCFFFIWYLRERVCTKTSTISNTLQTFTSSIKVEAYRW